MKHVKAVDVNYLHVTLAHAHSSMLQATARQHGFRLTGEPVSCSANSMAKRNQAPTAHHTTARAKRPMELVHIDNAGPFPASLGGFATGRLFKSLSRTVACSRELISIYICVIEGWT